MWQKEVSKVGLPTGSMQLVPGCWVCGELSGPLPMLCPECFCLWYTGVSLCWLMKLAIGLDSEHPAPIFKALGTKWAVAAPSVSTALQLPQKVVGCVCCQELLSCTELPSPGYRVSKSLFALSATTVSARPEWTIITVLHCQAKDRWKCLMALPLAEEFLQLVFGIYLLFYTGFIKTFCLIRGKDKGRTTKFNYFKNSFYVHLIISFSGSDQYWKL